MLTTEMNVRIEPATDQNSLIFCLFLDMRMRMDVRRMIVIGRSGLALSICIRQSFISFISPPSICLYFLNIKIMIPSAIAASAAAIPMMNRVNIIP